MALISAFNCRRVSCRTRTVGCNGEIAAPFNTGTPRCTYRNAFVLNAEIVDCVETTTSCRDIPNVGMTRIGSWSTHSREAPYPNQSMTLPALARTPVLSGSPIGVLASGFGLYTRQTSQYAQRTQSRNVHMTTRCGEPNPFVRFACIESLVLVMKRAIHTPSQFFRSGMMVRTPIFASQKRAGLIVDCAGTPLGCCPPRCDGGDLRSIHHHRFELHKSFRSASCIMPGVFRLEWIYRTCLRHQTSSKH
jgi:hypothetical protein